VSLGSDLRYAVKSMLSGNATKNMEKSLTALRFKIVSPPLISYVKGDNKLYQLRDGELEKAKTWSKNLAKALSK